MHTSETVNIWQVLRNLAPNVEYILYVMVKVADFRRFIYTIPDTPNVKKSPNYATYQKIYINQAAHYIHHFHIFHTNFNGLSPSIIIYSSIVHLPSAQIYQVVIKMHYKTSLGGNSPSNKIMNLFTNFINDNAEID